MDETNNTVDAATQRTRPWLRFGLRFLLLLIAVVAVSLAFATKKLRDRKSAIVAIRDAGGTFGYSIEGPEWLRSIVRDDECFFSPQRISLGPAAKDDPELNDAIFANVADALYEFPDLQAFDVRGSDISDTSGPLLGALTSVSHLRLSKTRISDEAIRHIVQLPNLQSLLLANTGVTDGSVDDLCSLKNLTNLDVRGTQITPTGVATLSKRLPKCKIDSDG